MTNKKVTGLCRQIVVQILSLGSIIAVLVLLLSGCGPSTDAGVTSVSSKNTPQISTTPTPTVQARMPTPTPTSTATDSTKLVTITGGAGSYAFVPDVLTIAVGTTVTWTNNTKALHTVTSDDGKTFNSGEDNPLASGKTFSFTFTKAGTYGYHCQYHASMKAKIVVQ